MKVLFINHVSDISGAEISLLMLLKHLDRKRFEPVVMMPAEGPLFDEVKKLNVKVILSATSKLKPFQPVSYITTVLGLISVLKQERPHLIHANMDICAQYALLPARLLKIPFIVHTRNILGKRPFKRMFLFGADILIANSNAVMRSFAEYSSRRQIKEVIYNGVDLVAFSFSKDKRNAARTKYGFSENDFVIGLFGRIHPAKGHGQYLKAFGCVLKRRKNVKTLIVGNTAINNSQGYLEELKRYVNQNDLKANVIFSEFEADNASLHSTIDLLVCPSDKEPFGRVLIEAMAMGVPVIANRNGGPLEIVDNGINGYLLDVNDTNAFTDAIIKLYDDPLLRKEMGREGRRIAEMKFSIIRSTEAVESIYRRVLKRGI